MIEEQEGLAGISVDSRLQTYSNITSPDSYGPGSANRGSNAIRDLNWGSNRGSNPAESQRLTAIRPEQHAAVLNSAMNGSDLQ
jgi:hypothetical protein